jgi:hypothetical protein
MADRLWLVIETFDCGIGNQDMEVVEDFVLMVSDHPGELSHRL